MALYRQNSTGFLIESATNPGAGYTAISSMPADLAGRVDWHRTLDTYGQTRGWHPHDQGYTPEKPVSPGLAGSGVNIVPYAYTSFESDSGLPPLANTNMTAAQVAGGYHGGKCLQLTAAASNATTYLNGSASQYNVKLTGNTRWIVSVYAASTTSGAKNFSLLLKTDTGTLYDLPLTTGATANSFTRVSGVLDLRVDNRPTAVLGIKIAASGVVIKFDALMMEEMIGDTATPSAFVQPFATIDGSVLEDGSIPNAKIIDLSASKLTAGTINAGTINVTNLNASNLTVGTINGSRFGADTIGAGPIIPGSLHTTLKSTVSSMGFPYQGVSKLTIDTSSFSSFNAGLPANPHRTACLLIMRVDISPPTAGNGYFVFGICRGSSTVIASRYNWWIAGNPMWHNAVLVSIDNSPGTGSLQYWPRQHMTNASADQYAVQAMGELVIVEFSK